MCFCVHKNYLAKLTSPAKYGNKNKFWENPPKSDFFLIGIMAKNKGGRPKQEVIKTSLYKIRLTEEQKKTLFYNAKQQHYKTTASYVLHKLFSRNFSRNVHTFSFQDAIRIEEVYQEISKCGVNINQVTKKINSLREEIDDSILIYEVKKLQEILTIVEKNSHEIYKLLIEKTKNLYSSESDATEEI